MRQIVVLKLALASALGVATLFSSQIRFETSALDDRWAEKNSANHHLDLEPDKKAIIADVDLAETHARPIFSPDRRPFIVKPPVVEQAEVVAEIAVEPAASLPRRLLLIGTNAGPAAASVLVRQQESAEVRWLAVGETFDGWRLTAASADRASFTCVEPQAENCEYQLELYSQPRSE